MLRSRLFSFNWTSRNFPSYSFAFDKEFYSSFDTVDEADNKNNRNGMENIRDILENSHNSRDETFSESQKPFLTPTYPLPPSPHRKKIKQNKKEVFSHQVPRIENHGNCSMLLFPGQGVQYPGMCRSLIEGETKIPLVKDIFDRASSILNYDLLDICLNGSQEELNRTIYSQPAVVVSSLAAVEALYESNPDHVENCIGAAGFSVGEITALIFAGAISFEDGIKLVKIRAEEMEMCSEAVPSGMMTVFIGKNSNLNMALELARKWCKEKYGIREPVIEIANHLYSTAKVIAGNNEALDFIATNHRDFQIKKCKRLNVSGAFHTHLMIDAVGPFKKALKNTKLSIPRIPVYSNCDMHIYKNREDIIEKLSKQIHKQVKWEQIMNLSLKYKNDDEIPFIYECGPQRSLAGILNQINGKAAKKLSVVSV